MLELLQQLIPSIVTGAICGLVTLGGMRSDVKRALREGVRAHKRLDLISAPNWTPEER